MTFKLTDSLIDDILFAMEDQNTKGFVAVDEDGAGVEFYGLEDAELVNVQDGFHYEIPEWTSDDGFALMEKFTDDLHSPLAKDDLRQVLASRRGVFRNFKNALRLYPEVEKKWFMFKSKCMKSVITEWYNGLCETWGLEKLEEVSSDSEETDELLHDDFEFTEYDSSKDKECVDRAKEFFKIEIKQQFDAEFGDAVIDMQNHASSFTGKEDKCGYVCYSQLKDFLGCSLFSECPSARNCVLMTDFFVVQNYRGLGIGRELMEKSLLLLKNHGIHYVIFSNFILSESMEQLLIKFSFKKTGSGYVLNLQ